MEEYPKLDPRHTDELILVLQKNFLQDEYQVRNQEMQDGFYTTYQISILKGETKYFIIDKHDNHYEVSLFPEIPEIKILGHVDDWIGVMKLFKIWVQTMKVELNSKNLWEKHKSFQLPNGFSVIEFTPDEKFDEQEKEFVKAQIILLRERFVRLEIFNSEQLETVNEKLNYISKKVDTLDKLDWKNAFLGTILSLIASFFLPPETGKLIWNTISDLFKKVILLK